MATTVESCLPRLVALICRYVLLITKKAFLHSFWPVLTKKFLALLFDYSALRACWRRVYAGKGREREIFQGERIRNSFGHQKKFLLFELGAFFFNTAAILSLISLNCTGLQCFRNTWETFWFPFTSGRTNILTSYSLWHDY